MLQEAKTRRDQELRRELEKKVKDDLLPKIMQRQGIVKLIGEVKEIGHQLSESAQKLQGGTLMLCECRWMPGANPSYWTRR